MSNVSNATKMSLTVPAMMVAAGWSFTIEMWLQVWADGTAKGQKINQPYPGDINGLQAVYRLTHREKWKY